MVPHAAVLERPNSLADRSLFFRAPQKERLPHVLCVEQGNTSSITQILALQAIGCCVESAGPLDVSDLLVESSFRVAVFGHTLSHAEATALAVGTRVVSPGTKLVLVTGTQPACRLMESLFDAIVLQAKGMAALAISVRRLLASDGG